MYNAFKLAHIESFVMVSQVNLYADKPHFEPTIIMIGRSPTFTYRHEIAIGETYSVHVYSDILRRGRGLGTST